MKNGLIHYRYADPDFFSIILEELLRRKLFDKIICPCSVDLFSGSIPEKMGVRYIPYNASFVETYDVNKLIPVPKAFIESFSRHENIALNMLIRHTYADAYTFRRAREKLFMYVRYWYHFFITEGIDFYFARYIGQYMEEYVIYAVADVLGVPTVCFYGEKWGWGIDDMGSAIERKFNELIDTPCEDFTLSDRDELYYQEHRGEARKTTKINSIIEKKEVNRCIKIAKDAFSLKKIAGSFNYCFRSWIKGKKSGERAYILHARIYRYENTGMWIRTIREYLNRISQREYNRKAENPDYTKKYIYCALQTVPEIALTPLVGYCDNQLYEIGMLSYCARLFDMDIYVKEHIYQHWRDKFFYDEILRFDNVHLIKTTVNTYELIDNCEATATFTGSCALEGVLRDKPALVFSRNEWKGLPGSYYITDEHCLNSALREICENRWSVSDREIRAYFKARELAGDYANRGEGIIYPDDTQEQFEMDACFNVDFIEARLNEAVQKCKC